MTAPDAARLVRDTVDLLRREGAEHPTVQERLDALRDLGAEVVDVVGRRLEEGDGEAAEGLAGLVGALFPAWLDAGVEPEALGGLLGRDRDVDLLLLERLGDVPRPEAAALIQRSADSRDREVAKAARRALHRLRSRGVEVPERRRSGGFSLSIEPDVRGEARAWRTGVDGNGARIVWVLTPSPSGGHRLLEAVVDDERGIRRAHVSSTTRKAVREHLEQLGGEPSLLVAPAPPERVVAILRTGERLAREADEELPADYRQWREGPEAALFEEPAEAASRPTIHRHLDDEAVSGRPDLLEASAELLGEPAFANWAHLGAGAERAARRVREAEESRLAVDDEQRKELIEAAVAGVAEDFGPELRRRYRHRLESMASLLWESGRREDARKALAAAVGFTEVDALYERHPFARALIQRGVFVAYRRQPEGGGEEEESRIIRP